MCFVLYGKGFLFVYNTKLGLFVLFSLFLAKGLLFVCNKLGIFSFFVFHSADSNVFYKYTIRVL